jgi:PilZ domain
MRRRGNEMLVSTDIYPSGGQSLPSSRRRSPRLNVDGRVLARLIEPNVPVDIRDFSYGGMATETNVSFNVGRRHQFSVMTDTGLSVMIWATAVHCRESMGASTGRGSRYLTGWRFVPSPETQKVIERIMEVVTSVLHFE